MDHLFAHNQLSATSNSPCAIVKALRQINPVEASDDIKDITWNCRVDMFTLTGILFNGTRNQTLPEVNWLFDDVGGSTIRQEVYVRHLQSQVHPQLRPLINRMRLAVIKGANCNKRLQRSFSANEGRLDNLMFNLQDDLIQGHASADDMATLRSKAAELHQLINGSATRRREAEVEESPVISVLMCVLPVLAEVEKVIANQRIAKALLERFLAHVDLVLILGMERSLDRYPEAEAAYSSWGELWCHRSNTVPTEAIHRFITLSMSVTSATESVIRKGLRSQRYDGGRSAINHEDYE